MGNSDHHHPSYSSGNAADYNCTDLELQWRWYQRSVIDVHSNCIDSGRRIPQPDMLCSCRPWPWHHHLIQQNIDSTSCHLQSSRSEPRLDFCADTADFPLAFRRPIVDVDDNGQNRAAFTSNLPRSASFHGCPRQNQHLPTPMWSSWPDHESLSGELRRGASQPNLQETQHLMDFQHIDVDLEKGIMLDDNSKRWESQDRCTVVIPAVTDVAAAAPLYAYPFATLQERIGSSVDKAQTDRQHRTDGCFRRRVICDSSEFGKLFVIPSTIGLGGQTVVDRAVPAAAVMLEPVLIIDGTPSSNVVADIDIDDASPSTSDKMTTTAAVVCRQQYSQSYDKSELLPQLILRSSPPSCVDVIKTSTSSPVYVDPPEPKQLESDDLQWRVLNREMLPPDAPSKAARYFRALGGSELQEIHKEKEDDSERTRTEKLWPFLLRFPVACFGICLGLSSQSILWKTISAAAATMGFLDHIFPTKHINLAFWCAAMAALLLISATYSFKCFAFSGAVRREFRHPVRANFFFAPWIAGMFLVLGLPSSSGNLIDAADPLLWAMLMSPVLALELKIYGQWLSGGESRRLSEVANPTTHLSVVGNFVGALLAAAAGLTEAAVFFWAVGLVHYVVLFVSLYQRLPTAMALPADLHPVFFMFVSAPCTASVAWSEIVGDFDLVSRLAYFVGLFLYASLVVRVKFFCGFRFSIAWWAYTFPMTETAIATIHYSLKVDHPITKAMAVLLSLISSATVLSLCVVTVQHILRGTMFPNDMAIAIAADSINKTNKLSIKEETSESSRNIVNDDIITGYGNVKGGKQANESWVNG